MVGAHVKVTVLATGETRQAGSGKDGSIVVSLLPPGNIRLDITSDGFKTATIENLAINVTETRTVEVKMAVSVVSAEATVTAQTEALHTEGTALGDVVSGAQVTGLPLVTRNFTQVIALNAGVASDVTNASDPGRGAGGNPNSGSTDGSTYSHGDRGYDNDFQMNGLQVNDLYGAVGGTPIPNPDTIEEFRVQSAQYDASFGRHAGASVDLITKSGSNTFHGAVFEFFRNTDLDASNFFSKLTQEPRSEMNQNQFGGTFGGPIEKNKLFFFGSYQGTRQLNGIANLSTVQSPLFTNDRSPAALGSLFAGQEGYFQTIASEVLGVPISPIAANGSNINPSALAILQAKQSNGQYIVPTPQTTQNGIGVSTYSPATVFNEDQYMSNASYQLNSAQRLGANFFIVRSNMLSPMAGANLPDGYSQNEHDQFIVSSLQHDWILTPRLISQFRFGFNTTTVKTTQNTPYSASDYGISVPLQNNNAPNFQIYGSDHFGGAEYQDQSQNVFTANETLAWTKGNHTMRFGVGASKASLDFGAFAFGTLQQFETWPDFLLGNSAANSGIPSFLPFSIYGNTIATVDLAGNFNRAIRVWEADAYAQDDYRIRPNLTLNIGVRFDWTPPETDALGHLSSLNLALVNPNPPAGGSLAGVVVSNNFPGTVPSGVTQNGGGYVTAGSNDGSFGPRIGFSWQPFASSNTTVVRGGYGVYYSLISGSVQGYASTSQPFGNLTVLSGANAGNSTLQNPFPGGVIPTTFPTFTPYSPSTVLSAVAVQNNIRPGLSEQASLGVQQALPMRFVLELATVATRGTHLLRDLEINQASLASAANPVRGATANTVANVQTRVPYQGYSSSGLTQIQSEGASWYNDLEATLRKQFGRGMTFQAAYTFSKTLDTDAVNASATGWGAGGNFGNQLSNHARYGVANFSRPQRLVVSYVYQLPFFREATGLRGEVLKGWGVSGVTTIQSGHALTLQGYNADNAYGLTGDFAQLGPNCTPSMEGVRGSVKSKIGAVYGKTSYFNNTCLFTSTGPFAYPTIANGTATDFGNSGVSPVRGPGQDNYDISILKSTRIPLNAVSTVDFRADMFNAFNTPQFSDPDTNTNDGSNFGAIGNTSVAARIVQLALKVNF